MKIKITHESNSIQMRGDLEATAILNLSLKGIMRHTAINYESNLSLTKDDYMGGQIEDENYLLRNNQEW